MVKAHAPKQFAESIRVTLSPNVGYTIHIPNYSLQTLNIPAVCAMSTQKLSIRLSTLSDSLRTTLQLISRLSKLSFAPGSTPLEGDGDVRVELTQDIRDSLKQHEEDLEYLSQEVEDLTVSGGRHSRRDSNKDRDRARLAAQVARLGEDLKQ